MELSFDITAVRTPAYVIDRELLIRNLKILRRVRDEAGCKILLAQKAFSMFYFYPLISQYLDGASSSGYFEAKLAYEHMGKQNHIFSPAYRPEEFPKIAGICDHIVFNSLSQWRQLGKLARAAGASCGLRVNPECSTQHMAIYDPCANGSRLGVTRINMPSVLPEGIEGIHFHTLCEQNADALALTLGALVERFDAYLSGIKWLNMGGGHHITRADYNTELLIDCIRQMKERYQAEIFLEPGEAIALNAGYLVTTVMDVVENVTATAILDASAACHMPDVLEMPYRPPLLTSRLPRELPHTYTLAGPTCLAGDIIDDYSFAKPLHNGDRLVFADMAIYTMVKNNTFNGMRLPNIYAAENGELRLIRSFGYDDFKSRLS